MEIKPESKGRGGKRPGAGRKPRARPEVRPGSIEPRAPAESKPESKPISEVWQPRWSREDVELARRAARQNWSVPDALKTEALYQAGVIFADPLSSPRDRAAAQRFLVAADRTDLLATSKTAIITPDAQALRELLSDLHPEPPPAPPGDCAEDLRGDDQ